MNGYKHLPPKSFYGVTWANVQDWWENELGNTWGFEHISEKYIILKKYNKTFFPNGTNNPVKPTKPIRYLNRVETSC